MSSVVTGPVAVLGGLAYLAAVGVGRAAAGIGGILAGIDDETRAAEELRRAQAVADDAWKRIRADVDSLHHEVRASSATYGQQIESAVALPHIPKPSSNVSEAAKEIDRIRGEIEEARQQLSKAVQRARQQRLIELGARVRGKPPTDRPPTEPAHTPTTSPMQAPDVLQRDLERVLGRLPGAASENAANRATGLLQTFVAETNQRQRERLIETARLLVQEETDRVRVVEANRKRVEELLERIDGVDMPGVDDLRDALRAQPLDRNIPATLREQVNQARAEYDRPLVLDRVTATLAEMGYAVHEGFATAVPVDGKLMRVPHSRDHGVLVRFGGDRLQLEIARFDDAASDQSKDARVEQEFCSDVEEMVERLDRQGIGWSIEQRVPPGARPPLQVARPTADAAEKRQAEKRMRDRRRD